MTTLSICLSLGALVVAAFAAGWQVRSFLRSGPVIHLHLHRAPLYAYGPGEIMRAISGPATLTLNVINDGRISARVTVYGFQLRSGAEIIFPDDPRLPMEVAPQSRADFAISESQLAGHLRQQGSAWARIFVRLDTQTRVRPRTRAVVRAESAQTIVVIKRRGMGRLEPAWV